MIPTPLSAKLDDTMLPVHAACGPADGIENGNRGEGNGGLLVGAPTPPALRSDTKLDAVGEPAAGRSPSVSVRVTSPPPTNAVTSLTMLAPKSTSKTASLVPAGSCGAFGGGAEGRFTGPIRTASCAGEIPPPARAE